MELLEMKESYVLYSFTNTERQFKALNSPSEDSSSSDIVACFSNDEFYSITNFYLGKLSFKSNFFHHSWYSFRWFLYFWIALPLRIFLGLLFWLSPMLLCTSIFFTSVNQYSNIASQVQLWQNYSVENEFFSGEWCSRLRRLTRC